METELKMDLLGNITQVEKLVKKMLNALNLEELKLIKKCEANSNGEVIIYEKRISDNMEAI